LRAKGAVSVYLVVSYDEAPQRLLCFKRLSLWTERIF
jgi:hypothetical protein